MITSSLTWFISTECMSLQIRVLSPRCTVCPRGRSPTRVCRNSRAACYAQVRTGERAIWISLSLRCRVAVSSHCPTERSFSRCGGGADYDGLWPETVNYIIIVSPINFPPFSSAPNRFPQRPPDQPWHNDRIIIKKKKNARGINRK